MHTEDGRFFLGLILELQKNMREKNVYILTGDAIIYFLNVGVYLKENYWLIFFLRILHRAAFLIV